MALRKLTARFLSPDDRQVHNVEHCWNNTDGEKSEYSEKNLSTFSKTGCSMTAHRVISLLYIKPRNRIENSRIKCVCVCDIKFALPKYRSINYEVIETAES